MSIQGKARILNSAEHKQFLQFLSNTRHPVRNVAIYLLSVRAGLRVQSLAGILLDDVIEASANSTSAKPTIKEVLNLHSSIVKGGRNYAIYLTHPELRDALTNYISERPTDTQVPNLFINQQNKAFTANSLAHTLLRLYRRAGFDNGSSSFGSQNLRHQPSLSGRGHRCGKDPHEPRQYRYHSRIHHSQR